VTAQVSCFGETMALVVPDPPAPLAAAEHFVLTHAGAESNVAVALARLGTATSWCSRVGDDPFGRRVLAAVGAAGVDTSAVQVCAGVRTGVFFKDPGPDGTRVHYYRDGSAASGMDESDAERAVSPVPRILHLTGITPALSASCARAVGHAVTRAHDLGVQVSFDVNYRPALWPEHPTAAEELLRLAQRCDVVLVGLDEAATLWQTDSEAEVRTLIDRPAALVVKDGARSATAFEDGRPVQVPALEVEVVEIVGAGDAFAAGWLHGRLTGATAEESLRLGHLLAASALSSPTDHGRSIAVGALRAAAASSAPWPPPSPLGEQQP
jgi:2-dehydro-3-deoxygluconokinase